MKIKLLDSSVANKIAAGEVVERPASIVKELTENSIDAGATNITVEIKGGGIDLIRVTDNGCGMEEEDVKTAFLRHATSKISVAEDLDDIVTLGFRGEALASIAAVANVDLQTRTASSDSGTEITLSGGAIEKLVSCGCPDGTGIWVRDLFFNTPARRKFLKRPSQEASYVLDVIIRIALSNPKVSLRFISEGKPVLRTPGDGQMLSVIRALFGAEASTNVIPVSYEKCGVAVSGYVGKREIQKSNRSSQYLFINGRSVKNALVSSAAQSAYAGRLNIGKFPFFVLEMKMRGNLVDVNVHPTKQEVRFADGLPIYEIISSAVSDALNKNQEIPTLFDKPAEKEKTHKIVEIESIKAESKQAQPEITVSAPQKPRNEVEAFAQFVSAASTGRISVNDSTESVRQAVFEKNNPTPETAKTEPAPKTQAVTEEIKIQPPTAETKKSETEPIKPKTENAPVSSNKTEIDKIQPIIEPEQQKLEIEAQLPDYSIIGVLFDTYIIITAGDDAYIIDQHAAHERILFERFFEKEGRESASQLLLIPDVIKVSPAESAILEDYLPALEEIGFEIENMGFGSFAVKATPAALENTDCNKFITSLLDEHISIRSVRTNELKRERLMQLACKSAVKAGDKLTDSDIKKLIRLIVNERVPLSCPHGRPILISLSKHELEVRFKRIQ